MKIKKIISNGFLLSGLALALFSCSKDVVQPVAMDQAKMDKVQHYISIMWEIPEKNISFNQKDNSFSFGQFNMSKEEIEHLYDNANEYKAKHENK